MTVRVQFWSYFKDLADCAGIDVSLPGGSVLGDAIDEVYRRHPKLAGLRGSTLLAVGLDYQDRSHPLKDGDEISMFPPVQGG